METGYGAAGNGYKQNWEQVTGFLIVETSVRRKVHCRMCDKQSNDGTDNHTGKHKGCHQVTRFHQKPHRKNGCEENVGKYHVGPVRLGGNSGQFMPMTKAATVQTSPSMVCFQPWN